MTDHLTAADRSHLMSRVRQRSTTPECVVRSELHRLGYRFRLHRVELPGTPDIVLPCHRRVVFVHGCFWHGHRGCGRSRRPATNVRFWTAKLDRNIERDSENLERLRRLGWKVTVIWECETKDRAQLRQKLKRALR